MTTPGTPAIDVARTNLRQLTVYVPKNDAERRLVAQNVEQVRAWMRRNGHDPRRGR